MARVNVGNVSRVQPGTHESHSYTVPVELNGVAELRTIIDNDDLIDPDFNLSLDVMVSDDLGATWRRRYGLTYVGGIYDPQGMPGISTNVEEFRGKQVMLRVTINKRIRLGFEFEDNPPLTETIG